MFVCSNRKIAYAFYQIVVGMRPEWAEKKVCPDGVVLTEKEQKELKPIEKIKLIMTRNKDDEWTLMGISCCAWAITWQWIWTPAIFT